MNNTDSAVRAHMATAADLVQLALIDLRKEDPAGSEAIAQALRAGALLTLGATMSSAGFASFSIALTSANGETLGQLMSLELQREAIQ